MQVYHQINKPIKSNLWVFVLLWFFLYEFIIDMLIRVLEGPEHAPDGYEREREQGVRHATDQVPVNHRPQQRRLQAQPRPRGKVQGGTPRSRVRDELLNSCGCVYETKRGDSQKHEKLSVARQPKTKAVMTKVDSVKCSLKWICNFW